MANKSIFCMVTLHLVALALAGCGGTPPPIFSDAARLQGTSTGIPMGHTEAGVPTRPSVEYVRTRMSRSIFVDPPEESDPVVYVRVRDSSGSGWDLQQEVVNRLEKNGYRVENNLQNAVYFLQVNVLSANEVSAAELAQLDETEYGQDVSSIIKGGLKGAAVGGLAGGVLGENALAGAAGAAAGGLLGGFFEASDQAERKKRLIAKQYTKFYSVIVDINIGERAKSQGLRTSTQSKSSDQSTGGSTSDVDGYALRDSDSKADSETSTFSEKIDWKVKETRIIGKAKGKLIAFADVEQEFRNKIASSISGLF